jgi:flagellar hook-basal body complex protein FliE
MQSIQSLTTVGSIPTLPAAAGPAQTEGGTFKDFLLDSIRQVNTMQQQADQSVENLFTGGDANPAEVLSAVQKADLAFHMMMQVRNKLVQIYQDVKDIRI